MNARKQLRPRQRKLALEGLEARQLMAGNIHAFVQEGTLFVQEAAGHEGAGQGVIMSQLTNGKIRLTGFRPPGDSVKSLVNGSPVVEFSNVSNIDVRLGGGRDGVFLSAQDDVFRINHLSVNTAGTGNDADIVSVSNLNVLKTARIVTGAGRDVVHVIDSIVSTASFDELYKLEINTGVATATGDADRDEVLIHGLETACDVSIKTGASNDVVVTRNSNLGINRSHLLWFDLGAGDDTLQVGPDEGTVGAVGSGGSLRVDAQDGADTVRIQDVFVDGGIAVQLGAGNDVLDMVNVQARQSIALRGGVGDDTLTLTQVEAFENFFAYLGEGSDLLDITFIKANRVELDGGDGDGYDKLFLTQSPNIPTLVRRGFEEINGRKLIKKVAAVAIEPTNAR